MTVLTSPASDVRSGSTAPLLSPTDDATPTASAPLATPPPTPLPKFQLFIICIMMLAEPIAYTQIFPYVNEMCYAFGWARSEKEVGHVSGMIDSLFAIANLLTIMHWGRLSDRIGRKPVFALGLLGVLACTLVFGFSRNLYLSGGARLMMGAVCGNEVVSQSIISELTDETNEGQAFAFMSLMWAVGCIVGPIIGGGLSRPADQWPEVFDTPFWRENPYLLPSLASAGIMLVSLGATAFLEETLRCGVRSPQQSGQDEQGEGRAGQPGLAGEPEGYETIARAGLAEERLPLLEEERVWTTWELVKAPGMIKALGCTFLMMFENQAWDILFILYCFTPLSLGGLSMSNAQIGSTLSFAGSVGAVIQLFIFPPLERRWGMKLFPVVLAVVAVMYAMAPVLREAVRASVGDVERGKSGWGTVVGACGLAFLGRVAAMIFPLTFVLYKRISPSPTALASTAGLGMALSALARALAPWLVSSLFAFSVESNLLGGNLVWVVMTLVVAASVGYSRDLDKALGRAEKARAKRTQERERLE